MNDPDVGAHARVRKVQLISAAVAILVTLLIVVLATRPDASNRTIGSPLIGQAAPNVTGTALDGRTVDLSEMRGRYVILNFFATWCGPCREEHPEMRAFAEAHTG